MRERGDTLIEVIFAVTVFSMVAVGGLALMNQGAAMAQRSLEIGMVRDQMDAQADALRYLHGEYIANLGQGASNAAAPSWSKVTADAVTASKTPSFNSIVNGQGCSLPADSSIHPFALDIQQLATPDKLLLTPKTSTADAIDSAIPALANSSTAVSNLGGSMTFAQVRYASTGTVSQGIWIVPISNPHTADTVGSYDFNIYACWLTPGQAAPVTLGTVVRLYDPNN